MIMRRIALMLIISAILLSFAACGGEQLVGEQNDEAEVTLTEDIADDVQETPAEDVEDEEEPTEETADDETRTITDMSGREVIVPTQIDKVYGTNNTSSIFLYTLAPDKMIGWNNKMANDAMALIAEGYADLPVLGNMYGSGKEASAEEVLAASPDVVLITGTKLNGKIADDADELQERIGVPVVVVIANMSNYDEAYTFLGELIGEQERAAELAAYYTEKMEYAAEKSAMVEQPVNVYYARMDDGLTTEFAGSPNAELIELVGAVNVAVSDVKETAGEVSIEQIMLWNPEVILIGHIGQSESKAMEVIMSDESWSEISAVQNENVISTPRLPFNWFDRPPSVNRLIGLMWLGSKLYPDIYDLDIVSETKDFYELFYGVELTDEQAEELIG